MLNKYHIVAIIWSIFFTVVTIYWILRNTLPLAWDQAYYLAGSEMLYKTLINHGFLPFLAQTTTILTRLAPLISILPVPLYILFGQNSQTALMVNVLLIMLFFFYFYLLVARLHSEKIAVLSVLIISTMPLFYGLSRQFFVEFGLMTLVIIWLYFLLKTENLTNKKNLIILGVISGLGMLMKFHFFLFVAGPFFYIIIKSWKEGTSLKTIFINLLYVFIPAVIIAFPWYIRNLIPLLYHVKRATNPDVLKSDYYGSPFSIETITRTFLDQVNFAISGYYFILFSILSIVFYLKKQKLTANYFLLSYFLFPFIIFFFGPNKDYRLILPLLPPIAIFISWLYFKSVKKLSFHLIPIILVIPFMIFLNTTLPLNFSIPNLSLGPVIVSAQSLGYAQRPIHEYWPLGQIITLLNQLDPANQKKTIVSASEHFALNINTIQYYGILYDSPITFVSASYFYSYTKIEDVKKIVDSGNYLILKQGGLPGPPDLNSHNSEILNIVLDQKWNQVKNDITFPDGGKLLIYQNPKYYGNKKDSN